MFARAFLLQGSIVAVAAFGLPWSSVAFAQFASPPPGKALIVLYRNDKQPVAARVPVIANADRLGELGNGQYVGATVNPGRTFLRAGDRVLATLAIQTSANQRYYVHVEAIAGTNPVRVEMRAVSEAIAQRDIQQGRTAAPPSRAPLAAAPAAAPRAPVPAPAPAPAAPRAAPAAAPPPPQRQAQVSPPRRPAPKEAEPEEEEEESDRTWTFAAIAKTGAFKLSSASQQLAGQTSTLDQKAKSVFSLEAELRHRDGLAFGAEIFTYKNANTLTVNGSTVSSDQTVLAGMFNIKYYFEATRWLYPFVGVGAGFASAKFSGGLQGNAAGGAYQGLVGADFRFSRVLGLYLEYKYLNASISDDTNQTIQASGSGIFAGLSLAF